MASLRDYILPVNDFAGDAISAYRTGQQDRVQTDQRDALSQNLPQALAGGPDATAAAGRIAATGGSNVDIGMHLLGHIQTLNDQQKADAGRQAQIINNVYGDITDWSKVGPDDLARRAQIAVAAGAPADKVSALTPQTGETLVRAAKALPGVMEADRAAREFADKHLLSGAQTAKANADAAQANAQAERGGVEKADQYGAPMMIDVRAPDGSMTTTLAQQNKTTGQWVTADDKRTGLGSPEGVTPPGGSGRFQVQAGRVMAAAEDVLRTVKTINAMPITASTGIFGTANAKTTFFGAPLNYLRQSMSDQQVQTYNALAQGLARSVVSIENQGLAPTGDQIASAAAQLLVQPGDTYLTRIQKQAEFRQHTEAHLEPLLHGTMTTPEQKVYIRRIISDLHTAIPYTVQDIIDYSSKPDDVKFGDYARQTVLRNRPAPAATATPPGGAPAVRQEFGGPNAPAGAVQPPPPDAAVPPANDGWTIKQVK